MDQMTEGAADAAPAFTPDEMQRVEQAAAATRQQHNMSVAGGGPGLFQRIASDIGGGIMEAPVAALRGVTRAVDAAAGGLEAAVSAVAPGAAQAVNAAGSAMGMSPETGGSAAPVSPLMFNEPETVTGNFVSAISQFVTGYAAAGGALRILTAGRSAQIASTAGQIGRGMVQGAAADAAFFDAHEERLSNLIEQYPALSNPVTAFLASDPNDTEAAGRFKNTLEGLALGGVADSFIQGVRALALRRAGRTGEAADAAAGASRVPSTEDILRADVADDVKVEPTGPSAGAADEAAPRAGDEAAPPRTPTEDPAADIEVNVTANAPRRREPLVRLSDEDLTQIERQVSAEQGFGQGRNLSGIRLDLVENGDDLAQIMSALRIQYREAFDRIRGGDTPGGAGTMADEAFPVRTFDEVRERVRDFAREVDGSADELTQRMLATAENVRYLDVEVQMYRDLLATSGNRLHTLARYVADPLASVPPEFANRAALMMDFTRMWERYANMTGAFKGIQSNIARSLNVMRLPANIRGDIRFATDALFDGGEDGVRKMAARILAAGENTAALSRATRGGFWRNAMGTVNEYWINSILSGVKTQAVNIASNTVTAFVHPTERMIAGAFRVGSAEGRAEFRAGARQFVTLAGSLRDAFTMAGKALYKGDTILDPGVSPVEIKAAITARNLNVQDPVAGLVTDGIGAVVRAPSRFLMAQDEFFKQLTYRSRIRSEAIGEGMDKGLRGQPLADFVEKELNGSFDGAGRATNDRHLRAAREVTFTDELKAETWAGGRTVGETLSDARTNHPALGFVLPFIRTPTNIARFVWNRTPVFNILRKQYFDDITGVNGPEARGKAWAMMTTGATMWGMAGVMAVDGSITGGGPSDPAARRALERTGWKPYSYRYEDPETGATQYVQFSRLDPFATFLGIAADLGDVWGFVGERDGEQIAIDMTTALARQLQNKTFLSGLTRTLAALADPSQRAQGAANQFVGSFVPTLLGQQFNDDPYMREVRGMVDALRARTPGYSESVDPQRNILGERITLSRSWGPDWVSPIATSTDDTSQGGDVNTLEWRRTIQTDVQQEIARQLSVHGASLRPPPKKSGTVDLTEYRAGSGYSAYDRYQELTGTVQVNGRNLHQALSEMIRSPAYRDVMVDGSFDHDGTRIDALRSYIGLYRNMAMIELRREIPSLDEALREDQNNLLRNRIRRE